MDRDKAREFVRRFSELLNEFGFEFYTTIDEDVAFRVRQGPRGGVWAHYNDTHLEKHGVVYIDAHWSEFSPREGELK